MTCSVAAKIASTVHAEPCIESLSSTTPTVRTAIVRYLGHVRDEGLTNKTLASYEHKLAGVFAPLLGESVASLTKGRLADLRQRTKTLISPRTAAPYADATVDLHWIVARKFCRWCFLKGWLAVNPVARARRAPGGAS